MLSRRVPGYVCRDCRHAISSTPTTVSPIRRSFSSSRTQHKALATFLPTSSPELDQVFSRFRKEIFIPSIVSKNHHQLIYKAGRQELLTQGAGVTVTVQTNPPPTSSAAKSPPEETIRLEPLVLRESPSLKKGVARILKELRKDGSASVQDWKNVIPLLQGLKQAHRMPNRDFLPKLVTQANEYEESEPFDVALLAVKMGDSTGLTLANKRGTHAFMLGIFRQTLQLDNPTELSSLPAPTKPQTRLNDIKALLEKPEHRGLTRWHQLGDGHADMRRDPIVIATQLVVNCVSELSAGNTSSTIVANDLKKLLVLLKNYELVDLDYVMDRGACISGDRTKVAVVQGTQLQLDTILITALNLAKMFKLKSVLDKTEAVNVTVAAEKHTKEIQKRIDQVLNETKDAPRPTRGQILYEQAMKVIKS